MPNLGELGASLALLLLIIQLVQSQNCEAPSHSLFSGVDMNLSQLFMHQRLGLEHVDKSSFMGK
jgi:hypothetical protein